jgi:hypothetical protein
VQKGRCMNQCLDGFDADSIHIAHTSAFRMRFSCRYFLVLSVIYGTDAIRERQPRPIDCE